MRHIGTFDAPEQASVAHMSVRKDLDDTNLSVCDADAVVALFDAAQKKAVEAVGGNMPRKQRPRGKSISSGVRKTPSGEFEAILRWGGKHWYVGIFDTLQQASAAYISVTKDLVHVKPSALSADEVDAAFYAAKGKAQESIKGNV